MSCCSSRFTLSFSSRLRDVGSQTAVADITKRKPGQSAFEKADEHSQGMAKELIAKLVKRRGTQVMDDTAHVGFFPFGERELQARGRQNVSGRGREIAVNEDFRDALLRAGRGEHEWVAVLARGECAAPGAIRAIRVVIRVCSQFRLSVAAWGQQPRSRAKNLGPSEDLRQKAPRAPCPSHPSGA